MYDKMTRDQRIFQNARYNIDSYFVCLCGSGIDERKNGLNSLEKFRLECIIQNIFHSFFAFFELENINSN